MITRNAIDGRKLAAGGVREIGDQGRQLLREAGLIST
jgi:hypothetical protein